MKNSDQYQYLGNCPSTPTLTLTCDQFGLGEGQVGSCLDTDIDPKVRPGDQVKVADHIEDTAKINNLELLSNSNNGCYLN